MQPEVVVRQVHPSLFGYSVEPIFVCRRLSERARVRSAGGIVELIDCEEPRHHCCDRLVEVQDALECQARQIIIFLIADAQFCLVVGLQEFKDY